MLEESEPDYYDNQTYAVRCRLCRKQLLVSNKIKFSHSGKAEPCGNCLYLNDEFLPDWIKDEIGNSSWTKGRLKCPRAECTARVGGFDFVQGLLCGCGEFTIPAIWIQDGKVDVKAINRNDVVGNGQPNSGQVPELEKNLNILCPMHQPEEIKETCTAKGATTDQVVCTCSMSAKKLSKMTSRPCPELLARSMGKIRTNTSKIHEWTGAVDDINPNTSKPSLGFLRNASGESSIFAEISVVGKRSDSRSYTNVPEHITKPPRELSHRNRGKTNEVCSVQSISHEYTAFISPAKTRMGPQRAASAIKQHRTSTIHGKSSTQQKGCETHDVGRNPPCTKPSSNRFGLLEIEDQVTEDPLQVHNSSPDIAANQYHLTCAVCLDYFYQPYECPCSHVFCESCLRQLYHNRAGTMKCPICREPVKYIQPANRIREEIRQLRNSSMKEREQFEKTAKHKKWPLPPIGPFPFLRKRQTLVPSQDRNLVILASLLLLAICYTMLYILP
ncbi:uncharacterized protein LOC114537151 [Dendronephthya gigantea]|uniref:uncharacterized protein LOC114537151 n=1 Tax=Dendronephthya gigantea TaxID=151771 RepID=UPI00106A80CE|nr:uncharacterized protein LOC114537151 [Dendronephthya gigantea]